MNWNELQLGLKDQIAEIMIMLTDFPEACYYTSYHLSYNGTRLNDYATLENFDIFRENPDVVHSLEMVEGV